MFFYGFGPKNAVAVSVQSPIQPPDIHSAHWPFTFLTFLLCDSLAPGQRCKYVPRVTNVCEVRASPLPGTGLRRFAILQYLLQVRQGPLGAFSFHSLFPSHFVHCWGCPQLVNRQPPSVNPTASVDCRPPSSIGRKSGGNQDRRQLFFVLLGALRLHMPCASYTDTHSACVVSFWLMSVQSMRRVPSCSPLADLPLPSCRAWVVTQRIPYVHDTAAQPWD